MKTLSIVTNTYFAENFIVSTLDRLREVKKSIQDKVNVQIIVVDDGSKDNTVPILNKEQREKGDFIFIKLSRNFGSIYSYLSGFEHAHKINSDGVIYIASDLQEPLELIPQMVDKWLEGEKFVACIRKTRKDPLISKIFSKIYYILFNKFALPDFPRAGFDLMLIDRQVLREFVNCREKNYTPQQLIFWLGFKPHLIPYDRQERQHGKSGWTFSKKIKLAIDTFVSMSYFPIRFISDLVLLSRLQVSCMECISY